MNITEAQNIVFNLGSGLPPKDLSERECKILEEFDKDWFTKLGYSEDKDELPEYLKKNRFIFDDKMKRKILREIGYFFLVKNEWNQPKTKEEIYYIEFHDILFDKKLIIVCGHPGMLIGYKGSTISALCEYLKKFYEEENINIPSADIDIKENHIISQLFAFDTRY
jgi:hypothetical protein